MLNGILPMLITSIIAYYFASGFLIESKLDKLASVQQLKTNEVERYFNTIKNQVITLSEDKMIIDAATNLKISFRNILNENSIEPNTIIEMKNELKNYYQNSFGNEFSKQNSNSVRSQDLLNGLSEPELALQYFYIADNPNPLGSKHLLDRSKDNSSYSKTHQEIHRAIRDYADKFEYYDIFIADSETGHIIYSVFKELDFATSLISGPYSQSGIAEVFRRANKSTDEHSVHFVDYDQYLPSYNAPASFVSSPIYSEGKNIAVLIFQMPIGTVNAIMSAKDGMGSTGESILVGPDQLPRSNSKLDPENRNVVQAFRNQENARISVNEVKLALSGQSGVTTNQNYLDKKALISYSPVEVLGLKWGLISQVEVSEALAPVNRLAWTMTIIAILSAILSMIFGIIVARSISSRILSIASQLKESSKLVGRSALEVSNSSRSLAELSTEQASSITETAASIEEISSMVKNNLEDARKSSENSKFVLEKADNGNKSMNSLIASMQEITESNEKIQALVKVIEEIGDKTEIIDEIVLQTKLLSFNASVEAERAGEHGRGFSVVAQEVGNLAQMSGKASLEIASMVKGSLKSAEAITGENRQRVESANKQVQNTAKYLNEIAKEAENLFSQSTQILNASKEQSEGINQVNDAMNQLDETTQQNSEAADNSASASERMENLAKDLKDSVINLLTFVNGEQAEGLSDTKNQDNPPLGRVIGLDSHRPKPSNIEAEKLAVGQNSSNQKKDGWESI